MRRACDGEAAAASPIQQHVEILSRLKAQALDRGEPQPDLHDVGCERRQARDPAGQCLYVDVGDVRDEPRLDHQVRERARLAKQNVAGLLLGCCDPERPAARIADLTGSQPRTTRAAMARLATVGEVESCGEGGFEHRLAGADADGPAMRFDPDGVVPRRQSSSTAMSVTLRATRGHAKDRSVFTNPSSEQIAQLLRSARIIAVVGLSADPTRPSHGVARALQRFGYRIIPVTPSAEVILGEQAVPDLAHLRDVLGPGEQVDIVDVFRRPEHVAAIVEECIRLRVPALWLQDGVIDDAAAQRARDAGIFTVMDRCMFRDRSALR